jgi:hypothetical protein
MARAEQAIGFQLLTRDHHLPDALLQAVAAANRDTGERPAVGHPTTRDVSPTG